MTIRLFTSIATLAFIAGLALPSRAAESGDPGLGQRQFQKCVTCHSAEPNRHKTGPSLATVWGRKAGTVAGFNRYSDALVKSGVVWNDQTLDKWLKGPRRFIPGNLMNFPGLGKASERQDIIAYLKQLASGDREAAAGGQEPASGGGMMGMMGMGASELADITKPTPAQRVASLNICRDTYVLKTADGKTLKFWEFNLRFKTDSSDSGPPQGKPVLLPAGMMGGDRSFVVFNNPREISGFIEEKC